MARISIDVRIPDEQQLPPTKEEKFEALKECVSNLMEMVDVGHNEEYALKCLRVVLKKLKGMPRPEAHTQKLTNTIESFLLQQGK